MFKGLGGGPAPGTERWEVAVEPGGMSGQVAFSGSHLVNPACQELGKTHERVGGQGGRVGIVVGRGGQGGPLAEEDCPRFLFHCRIGILRGIGRGDHESGDEVSVEEGERGAAFQQREDSMGDFVNGEVLTDSPLMSLPHERAFRWVEFGQERAMALG